MTRVATRCRRRRTEAGARSGEGPGEPEQEPQREAVFDVRDVCVYYGESMGSRTSRSRSQNEIMALIGPSGCGKTTFLRCLNRMNDLIEGRASRGSPLPRRRSLRRGVDAVEVGGASAWCSRSRIRSPIHLRQHRLGPKIAGIRSTWTNSSRSPCARRRSGTRSRTSSRSRGWRSLAGSSSGSVSPGRSPRARRHPDG